MPLIDCPDCGKQISDAAPACIGCGRPMQDSESQATPAPASSKADVEDSTSRSASLFVCNSCGSDLVKKFSLIYQEQTSSSSSKTGLMGVGVGPSGMGVGVGGGKTKGTSVTDLAKTVAPPDRNAMEQDDPGTAVAIIGALLIAVLVFLSVGILWAIVALFVSIILGTLINNSILGFEERYQKAYAAWDRKYLCMRCGAVKTITENDLRKSGLKVPSDPELDRLIRQGQKIQAVKHVIDTKGLGLAEATAFVEQRESQLS